MPTADRDRKHRTPFNVPVLLMAVIGWIILLALAFGTGALIMFILDALHVLPVHIPPFR
jgi:hypothetical protein